MLWSLINTLQLISYLPLMTQFFPEHVRIMFMILKFANCDFTFLSNIFKSMIHIRITSADEYNELFAKNGISSSLFFVN